MTSLDIDKQRDTDVPNNILDGRACPTMPGVATDASQTNMKSRSMVGRRPIGTLPRERGMSESSPHFDRSAETVQNDSSTGNTSFPIIISARYSQKHTVFTRITTMICLSDQDNPVTSSNGAPLIGTISGTADISPNIKFILISFAEISVKVVNPRHSTHEDFCLSIDLDGKNIHQVLSSKEGSRDDNATRFLFNPPLLL